MPGGARAGSKEKTPWRSRSTANATGWRRRSASPRCWSGWAWAGAASQSRSTRPSCRRARTPATSWPTATGWSWCRRSAAAEAGARAVRDNPRMDTTERRNDPLLIAGRSYRSRLLTGTGKFRDLEETRRATEASGAEIVTVAIRRTNIGQNPGEPNLLDVLPPDRYTILPNTAGCYSAEDAVRTCRLARELLDGHALVKLEVLGDQRTLFPDVVQTLKAA